MACEDMRLSKVLYEYGEWELIERVEESAEMSNFADPFNPLT